MSDGKSDPTPGETPAKRPLPQPIRDAWLQVLGVWHSAESEIQKVSHRLLESLGIPPTDGSAQGIAKELMAKMRQNRDELEKKVEEGVKVAVQRVREPIEREIAQVRARVEELGRKLEEKGRVRLGKKKPDDATAEPRDTKADKK